MNVGSHREDQREPRRCTGGHVVVVFWSFASGTTALGYRIIDVRYSLIKHVDFNCWLFNVDLELDGGKKSSQWFYWGESSVMLLWDHGVTPSTHDQLLRMAITIYFCPSRWVCPGWTNSNLHLLGMRVCYHKGNSLNTCYKNSTY